MHGQAAEGLDARRLEHGRPVDGVGLENVFADQVLGAAPVVAPVRIMIVADGREIIEQRVEPNVGDKVAVEGNLDAPFEPTSRPGNAQVFERLAQEAQHFVAITFGPDEIGMRGDVVQQPVLILAHAEEVVLLLHEFGSGLMIGTLAVHQFLLGQKALAAGAIVPAVLADVDFAAVVDTLQNFLYESHVVGIGGTDEAVGRHVEPRPQAAETAADLVHQRLRCGASGRRRSSDLVAVLVGSGDEERVVAEQAMVTPQRVRQHRGVGRADVRVGVHIVNGSGDVVGAHGDSCQTLGQNRTGGGATSYPVTLRPGRMLPLAAFSCDCGDAFAFS